MRDGAPLVQCAVDLVLFSDSIQMRLVSQSAVVLEMITWRGISTVSGPFLESLAPLGFDRGHGESTDRQWRNGSEVKFYFNAVILGCVLVDPLMTACGFG